VKAVSLLLYLINYNYSLQTKLTLLKRFKIRKNTKPVKVNLAKGHVAALESNIKGINIYNLGTGKGTSVLELVNAFKDVNKIDIPYEIVERRPGDIAVSFADCSKAKKELNWEAKLTIEDMVRDAWNFENKSK
jgi:UDP-glucose 4-epimerase